MENAPLFLDGYANDGSCIVDPTTQKGIIDPESFTQIYDGYIAKLSTGLVLGMIDQWWEKRK